MRISKSVWMAVALAALAFMVRVPGLGSYITVDEESWIVRGSMFYDQLFREGDPSGTYLTTHPGATAMWIMGSGIFLQENRVGFGADTSNVRVFQRAADWPMMMAHSILIGLAAWLTMQLLGLWPGIVGVGLLALEPYLVGMSQIAHVDMLLGMLMLNAALAFLTKRYLPAGILAGLALGTKLPAVWIFAFFGVVLVWAYRWRIGEIVRRFGFLCGVAALTFFAVWPALWVNDDLGRSFEKDVTSVVTQQHVVLEDTDEPIAPVSFYARTVLAKTTPFVLILTMGALVAMVRYAVSERRMPSAGWLALYAFGFLVMVTLVAKKADRYALPALIALPLLAGWALSLAAQALRARRRSQKFIFGAGSLIIVLLFAQVFAWVPYTIAYNSPFFDVRPLSQQGWGEGLEAAAAWLNEQPLANETIIASWYPSVMQVYFHGQTFALSARSDERVSYVVTYRNMHGRAPDTVASDVLDEYRDQVPVHVVSIRGVPYAWIYATDSTEIYKQHVGEITGSNTVGQLIPISFDGWRAVEIGMANYSNRLNTQDVILHVREDLRATQDVRTVRVNAREIRDRAFHRFDFEPLADSAGKTFYVLIESPTSRPGDAVTVRFAPADILPGEMVRNGERQAERDVAYRISN